MTGSAGSGVGGGGAAVQAGGGGGGGGWGRQCWQRKGGGGGGAVQAAEATSVDDGDDDYVFTEPRSPAQRLITMEKPNMASISFSPLYYACQTRFFVDKSVPRKR